MESGNRDSFFLFYGGYLSQWAKTPFYHEEIRYGCAEQWMMAQKAEMFGDTEAHLKIMRAISPKQQKAYGREVRGFDKATWDKEAYRIVKMGNVLKFSQNEKARKFLLNTGDRTIVEASPYDRIWGVGLGEDHPDVIYPERWKGQNLLGKAIMDVRDVLR